MLILLTTLLGTLPSMFRSRAALEVENLALRQQVGVLRRSAIKRFDPMGIAPILCSATSAEGIDELRRRILALKPRKFEDQIETP